MKFFSFQWHITDQCDQRCKHCYIFNGGEKELTEMSWEDIEATFKNCLEFCHVFNRLPYFYLTGGDPILHPNFWDLLELFKENKISFTILGNPFHLTPEVCRKLKDFGCRSYQLSLDGLEKTHDWFRKPGSFKKTLEAVELINQAGINSIIMSTVSKTNYREIPAIVDTVVDAGVGVYAFSRYVPGEGEVDPSLSPKEYRDLLEICDQKFKSYSREGVKTRFNKKDHLWKLYEYETGEFQIPENTNQDLIYGGCNCGNSHLTILPSGEIYACRRVKDSCVGNVLEDQLSDVWTGKMEEYRDYKSFEKCKDCELESWCRGCPAVSKATFGSFYAPDPQCWKDINNEAT